MYAINGVDCACMDVMLKLIFVQRDSGSKFSYPVWRKEAACSKERQTYPNLRALLCAKFKIVILGQEKKFLVSQACPHGFLAEASFFFLINYSK